ncbi:hypothetical protein BD769DRAFT_1430921 [Suillus cothurnatus]|nr:hypothetical protein BD769DRAFT_1430921 [Suillus cothurnatus]
MCVGALSCLDGYMNIMNIVLEQTEEHVNDSVANRYGDAFIRGNTGKSFKDVWLDMLCSDVSSCASVVYICCRTAMINNIVLYVLRVLPRSTTFSCKNMPSFLCSWALISTYHSIE